MSLIHRDYNEGVGDDHLGSIFFNVDVDDFPRRQVGYM